MSPLSHLDVSILTYGQESARLVDCKNIFLWCVLSFRLFSVSKILYGSTSEMANNGFELADLILSHMHLNSFGDATVPYG
jgi:hypothetical protein